MTRQTLDLGRRVELHAMDTHCCDISIGLYRQDIEGWPEYLVHTYSQAAAAPGRLAFIVRGLQVLAGLGPVDERAGWLRFPCGVTHERALRRAFVEVCRLASDDPLETYPLTRPDKKAECDLEVVSRGDGDYGIAALEETENASRRTGAVARGFAKLFELEPLADDETAVRFDCGGQHDALLGLLFFRAQNVRSVMQEEELAASRGTLAAPGSQSSDS